MLRRRLTQTTLTFTMNFSCISHCETSKNILGPSITQPHPLGTSATFFFICATDPPGWSLGRRGQPHRAQTALTIDGKEASTRDRILETLFRFARPPSFQLDSGTPLPLTFGYPRCLFQVYRRKHAQVDAHPWLKPPPFSFRTLLCVLLLGSFETE